MDQDWQQLSEQILTDIKAWRCSHPKATLREIEEEVHARVSRLGSPNLKRHAPAATEKN